MVVEDGHGGVLDRQHVERNKESCLQTSYRLIECVRYLPSTRLPEPILMRFSYIAVSLRLNLYDVRVAKLN